MDNVLWIRFYTEQEISIRVKVLERKAETFVQTRQFRNYLLWHIVQPQLFSEVSSILGNSLNTIAARRPLDRGPLTVALETAVTVLHALL